jgi:hypothetical protein
MAALVVTVVPRPSMAEEPGKPAAVPGLRASADSAATAMASAVEQPAPGPARQAGPEAAKPTSSRAFFKTPVGVAVLAVMAAGVGYAIYSAHHDRTPVWGR